ncbi:MAG: hypothetical protein AABY75_05385 [Bacteroidota bacterium]
MTDQPRERETDGRAYIQTLAAWVCCVVLIVWMTVTMASISRSLELIALNLNIVMQMSVKTAEAISRERNQQ